MLGVSVSDPSSHLAGQASLGFSRTYCAALTLSINTLASRPIPSAFISTAWTTPSGSMINVPRCAKPSSSSSTSKIREIFCERSEEHTSELQSRFDLVCRLLLEKKNKKHYLISII